MSGPNGTRVTSGPTGEATGTEGVVVPSGATGRGGMTWSTEWTARAACRTSDPDALFVQGAAQNRAKVICQGCQVRTECLADALDNRVEFGVWGGMTERERRALLRRRSQVTSWRLLLQTARDEYERAVGFDAPCAS